MKVKRSLFVFALIGLFAVCYFMMNQHYDALARYPHELNEEQRALVLEYLNTDEINTLISQKIEPKQFLPYIEVEGFDLANTLWYDEAYRTQKENVSKDFIVRFINKYKSKMKYGELDALLTNYSFNALIRFFDEGDFYDNQATLIAEASNPYTILKKHQTLYTYEPHDLAAISDLPHQNIVSQNYDIFVKKEVVQPLHELCSAASEINNQPCGDMKIVTGYLSYEDQVKLLENAIEQYGKRNLTEYWDYPGHSEFQLGYSVQLLPNEMSSQVNDKDDDDKKETQSEEEKEQEIWLKDNAYKYGFIIRYPKSGDKITGKKYQPYTLRYVGKDMAKAIHNKNITIEEIDTSKYE